MQSAGTDVPLSKGSLKFSILQVRVPILNVQARIFVAWNSPEAPDAKKKTGQRNRKLVVNIIEAAIHELNVFFEISKIKKRLKMDFFATVNFVANFTK